MSQRVSLRVLSFARAALAVAVIGAATAAHAVTEIQWWHSMTGANNDRVNALAKRFNDSQKDFKVNAVYKGSYPESMAAAIAAFRAGNAPHVLQVFEVGTGTMMAAKGAIKPVYEVMSEAGEKFDPKTYVPAMAKLKASGHACPFTTGWQTWTQLESFSAWHNVPFLTKENGFAGPDAKLVFNGPVQVKHIENMQDWIKKGYFVYGGRKNEPEAKFFSGECAMLTTSSAAYGTIKQNAKFKFAESTLPYYADVPGTPQNTIIGGASLWIMSGKSKDEYKGVAKFMSFLSQPDVQAEFHQATGYLPITMAAYDLTKKSGFYEKNPGTDVAVQQMIVKTTNNSRGVRAGNFPQIRDAMDEELEAVWAGKKTAKQGLDDAVKRGNEIIDRFNKANKS